jgi:hypothetical protein
LFGSLLNHVQTIVHTAEFESFPHGAITRMHKRKRQKAYVDTNLYGICGSLISTLWMNR